MTNEQDFSRTVVHIIGQVISETRTKIGW